MPLRVIVGNGSVMDCHELCHETEIQIQSHTFTMMLRILPLSGADVILGVEWLRTLGLVVTHYTSFAMNFTHLSQPIHLRADVHTEPSPASAQQIRRMIHTHSTLALFHLSLLPTPQPEPPVCPIHPIFAIEDLILQFHSIFQAPTTLPRPRQNVHHINLPLPQNPSTFVHTDTIILKNLRSKSK